MKKATAAAKRPSFAAAAALAAAAARAAAQPKQATQAATERKAKCGARARVQLKSNTRHAPAAREYEGKLRVTRQVVKGRRGLSFRRFSRKSKTRETDKAHKRRGDTKPEWRQGLDRGAPREGGLKERARVCVFSLTAPVINTHTHKRGAFVVGYRNLPGTI